MIWKESDKVVAKYYKRVDAREITLMNATMLMVAYFIALGDTEEQANIKVSSVSTQIAPLLYVYTLGNKQPLIDAINNIDEVSFPYMDATAKSALIANL